jgi:hypothetical protein
MSPAADHRPGAVLRGGFGAPSCLGLLHLGFLKRSMRPVKRPRPPNPTETSRGEEFVMEARPARRYIVST